VTRRLSLLVAVLGLLALPSVASAARINVAVGIGDQSPRMFDDANWKALGLKKTRYFVEWNAIDQPDELAKADRFVAAARAARVKVLMHISTDDINSVPRRPLPSVSAYKSKVGALVSRYRPQGVTEWGTWNEANHSSQPTQRNPKRAAQYYKTLRGLCSRCKIVALDVLDQAGVERYIARWMSAAGAAGRRATVIGIHNYSEVNRRITARKATNRYPGTARIIKAVRKRNKRAKIWYTETGGVMNFGRAFRCNAGRQANRTSFMFRMIKTYDRNVERLYSYNWFGNDCNGFDAGLVEADGTPRPAYSVFKRNMRNVRK
jgi:hypothetical protein